MKKFQAGIQIVERYFLPILFGIITMLFLGQIRVSVPMTGTSGGVPLTNRPFPQHETYATGTIRPTNFTQAEQDQHVRDFYDYWKSSYVVSAGNNGAGQAMYRVTFGSNEPDATVSEGQGYGMVTVALMAGHDADAQTVFDGLWRFSRNYPSGIDSRLMSWKIKNGAITAGNDSAFDGDVDIAYGLLLADAQWGSAGEINYKAEADTVIAGILESTIGADSRLPKLGDWTSDNGSPYSQYTPRSSDFMPSHFRAFGRATNDTTWDTVISNSQAVIDQIQSNHSPTTGLLPDFIINCNPISSCSPPSGQFLESANDKNYYYNAGRDPWRMGLDALLNGDATSKAQVDKMVSWVNSNSGGSASNIKAGYQLDGTAIGNYLTTFFVAPFGVGAMLDSSQQSFLNDIYATVYNKQEGYYEDSVNMLALLAMTGNYWDPTANYTPPATNTPGPSPTASNTPIPSNTPTPSNTLTPSLTPVGGPCAVDYTILSEWDVGFTGNVKITNNDSSAMSGWSLTWTHAAGQQVTGPWNATVSQAGNDVTASNPADHWNGTIAANGGSVEFGFNGTHTGSVVVPTDFLLNGLACHGGDVAPTATATVGASPSATATPTTTASPNATATVTLTPTTPSTNTPSATATMTATGTPAATSSPTATGTPAATSSPTPTATETAVNTPTITETAVNTPTITETAVNTPTMTGTPAATGTMTGTPAATASPTATATETAANTPTATGTATNTPTAIVSPTASNTPQPGSCAVDYTMSQWNSGFTANLVINNHSGAEINGWTLTWSFPGNQQISSLWNGQHSQNGNQVTVSNLSYNGVIAQGGTQSFGFQATYSGPNGAPTDFALNGTPCNGPPATPTPVPPVGPLCSVEYVINSDWGVGFVANVEITNNSGNDWHDWALSWSFSGNQQVTNLWNGSHTQSGSQVTAQNASWNGVVLYGNTVNFGFQGTYSGNNELPNSFTVNGIDCNAANVPPSSTPEANAPSINELLPNQGQNDLPNEINLFGSNFQADSSVTLNLGSQRRTNVPLAPTFISANQLRVVIPAGLLAQTYDITVRNPDGRQGTLANAYTVTDAPQDDLLSYDNQLWSVPTALHASDEAQIGLHLYRQGGTETLSNVNVNFYLKEASGSQQLIGSGQVPLLAPESSSHTTAVAWTAPAAGDYTLIAIIDEANEVSEADESNNVLMRDITIMPAAEDVTPPTVDSFTINGGANETAEQQVELLISASDPTGATPSSNVESIFIIEYEFNQSLKQWIPANLSEWLPYSASPSTHNWTLLPSPGVKYLQVWARDDAGNISLASRSAMINYIPTSATLATGLSHFYAYNLSAGQTITAAITPTSGDPDLYIWPANGTENAFSINGAGEVDQTSFTANADGTYLIQVHAYQRAEYSLSVTIGNNTVQYQRNQPVQGKTPLSAPRLAPTDLPQDLTYALPSTPTTALNEVYLPLVIN